MKNVSGATGYTLKSITLRDTSFGTVSGTAPNFTITLKKAGKFNATLVLTKTGLLDQSVEAEIEAVLPALTFPKLTIGYKGVLNKTEILNQVAGGNKTGYTVKEIRLNAGADAVASVNATTGDLNIKGVGSFSTTLVLTNPNYFDISIANAQFEIVKATYTEAFSFTKLKRDVLAGGSATITGAQLMAQITGATSKGFTLKSIALDNAQFWSSQRN